LKICLLCYRANPYSGGQGIYLKYIAEELVRQGHEVHAIVGPPYPSHMKGITVHKIENNDYFMKKGNNVINKKSPFDIFSPINFYEFFHSRLGAFPEISSFSYRAYLYLRRIQKEYRFDLIHDNQSLGYGLLLMKTLGIPIIATIHHPLSIDLENVLERSGSYKARMKAVMFYPILMQKFVSKRLDHVITVSEDSRKTIARDFGVRYDSQTVVYNGIDRTIFRPLKNVKKDSRKIIFVGNVEDGKKGFVYLLRALTYMKEDVKLSVIDGGAPHRRITKQLIKKLGIEHMVDFKGTASPEQLVEYYSESCIAIVPSVYEGFGLPAAEAMSCGVPVIASDGGALPEVVGDAGVTVPARDEKALARAIDELIVDRKRQKEYSAAGIERVEKHFTWENAAKQMVEVWERYV